MARFREFAAHLQQRVDHRDSIRKRGTEPQVHLPAQTSLLAGKQCPINNQRDRMNRKCNTRDPGRDAQSRKHSGEVVPARALLRQAYPLAGRCITPIPWSGKTNRHAKTVLPGPYFRNGIFCGGVERERVWSTLVRFCLLKHETQ